MTTSQSKNSKYGILPSNKYEKDIRKLKKSGVDIRELDRVIDLLATGTPLPQRHKDHILRGSLRGVRECHIRPDWLLLYTKNESRLILLLLRTGTHRAVLDIE